MEILIGLILAAAIYFDTRYLRLKKNIPVRPHAAAAAFLLASAVLILGVVWVGARISQAFYATKLSLDDLETITWVFPLLLASLGYLVIRFGYLIKKAHSEKPPLPPESPFGIVFIAVAFIIYFISTGLFYLIRAF